MNRSQWHDWYLAALDGWHMLHDLCDRIVVLGMSMGGATALLMAARRPVAAVVSLSAPISLPSDPRLPFVRFIGAVQPFMDKENWTEAQRASRYPVVPTLAVGELRAYLNVVASALLAVTAPALLFHSRMDTAVPPANMERIFRKLGSVHKEMVWYEEARHVLTEDTRVQADLFARITAFIASWTGT
jgi:carboxylesterase